MITKTETFSLLDADGDVEYVSNMPTGYKEACGSATTMNAHGLLTYSRAEELFSKKSPRKQHKYMNLNSKLIKRANGDYHIEYEGIDILTIKPEGWWIKIPASCTILYPGLTNRIRAYTGVSLFKEDRKRYVCVGSMGKQYMAYSSSGHSLFIDYSYASRHDYCYQQGPKEISRLDYAINSRKISSNRGWWGDYTKGRTAALFGSKDRQLSFIRRVVSGYVTNYLYSHHRSSTNSFRRFCGVDNDYTYSVSNSSSIVDNVSAAMLGTQPLLNEYPLLAAPGLFSIDVLEAITRLNVDGFRPAAACGVSSVSLAIQGLFAMRGLKFIPDPIRLGRDIDSKSVSNTIKQLIKPSSKSMHIGKCQFLEPDSFSQFENYGKSNLDLSQRSRFFSDHELFVLNHRPNVIWQWFAFMCNYGVKTASPGIIQDELSVMTRSTDSIVSSFTNDADGRYSSSPSVYKTLLFGTFSNSYITFSPEDDDTRREYGRRWGSSSDTWMKVLPKFREGKFYSYSDPTSSMMNPFPRLVFLVMLDEYCSNSIYSKTQIARLLDSEWESCNGRSGSKVITEALPLSYEIMSSFLTKRIAGMFSRLFCPELISALGALYGFPTTDVSRRYGVNDNAEERTMRPSHQGSTVRAIRTSPGN